MTLEFEDCTVTIDNSPETKEALFNCFVYFCIKYQCFSGESFSQMDRPQIGAMELFPEILDKILQCKAKYK